MLRINAKSQAETGEPFRAGSAPIAPVELFRRGIEITREIRGKIEDTRAYYLGRSSREPEEPLSEVFNPETGPIIPYFVKVIRMLTHPQTYLTLRQSAALKAFERENVATLDALRRLAIDLAPLLDADDRQPAIGRSLKLSVYFFRVATGRFFRYLVRRRSTLHRLLGNQINEGFVLYVANRLLNDIAKAFEVRERQLRGESAAVEHEFFTKQLLMRESNEHKRILDAIEKVNRNQLLSHKLERQLLKTHDDHDDTANDSADDARHSTPVRAAMVQLTALKIYNSRASDANAIKYSFFKAFGSIPDAYDKYNSFSRAVDRMLRTYLS